MVSASLRPGKSHKRVGVGHLAALVPVLLSATHCICHPGQPWVWTGSTEGAVCFGQWRQSSCLPRLCRQQEFSSPPTWQEFRITHQTVDVEKVPGQAKRRPLHNQGPVLSLDLFGDDVEGTEGGNSDPLHVGEKGRAKGLRLKERTRGCPVQGLCFRSPAAVQRCRPGQLGEIWEGAAQPSPSHCPPNCSTAVLAEAASGNPEASSDWDQP